MPEHRDACQENYNMRWSSQASGVAGTSTLRLRRHAIIFYIWNKAESRTNLLTFRLLTRHTFETIEHVSHQASASFQTVGNVIVLLAELCVTHVSGFGRVHHKSNCNLPDMNMTSALHSSCHLTTYTTYLSDHIRGQINGCQFVELIYHCRVNVVQFHVSTT